MQQQLPVPVVFLTGEPSELPPLREGEMRYVMAANGLFLQRNTALFRSSVSVTSCPMLEDMPTTGSFFEKKYGAVPRALIAEMLGFFHQVHVVHRAEAGLVLLYHPESKSMRWECPPQEVSTGGLSLDMKVDKITIPEGWQIIGDSHSHSSAQAFFSGTDDEDDVTGDGIHLVAGSFRKPLLIEDLSWDARFSMDGEHFRVPIASVVETTHVSPDECGFPVEWMSRVKPMSYAEYKQGGKKWWRFGGTTQDRTDERRRTRYGQYGVVRGFVQDDVPDDDTDDVWPLGFAD